MNIYDFYVSDIQHQLLSLKTFENKLLLIFNSSLSCYLSEYYHELESIYRRYHHLGLELLDFPSDTFTDLSHLTIEEIDREIKAKYQSTFKRFDKISLKVNEIEPLFAFLEMNSKFQGFNPKDQFTPTLEKIVLRSDPFYAKNSHIKWNFTFFLISKTGDILRRFEPTTSIKNIENSIKRSIQY